jgi:hypothetical protein
VEAEEVQEAPLEAEAVSVLVDEGVHEEAGSRAVEVVGSHREGEVARGVDIPVVVDELRIFHCSLVNSRRFGFMCKGFRAAGAVTGTVTRNAIEKVSFHLTMLYVFRYGIDLSQR